jgi:hypothetical protein
LQSQCAEYETALTAIVTDYVDYLRGEGLLESRDDRLLVVPCGQSYEENKRFGLYYDAVNRPSRSGCRYLGLYKNRTVSLIGDITEERLIEAAIEATSYDLKGSTQRYFVTDGPHETEIRKTTPGGIMGPLYVKLGDLQGTRPSRSWSTGELARALAGKAFPVPAPSTQ